jgi:hypothetical protein
VRPYAFDQVLQTLLKDGVAVVVHRAGWNGQGTALQSSLTCAQLRAGQRRDR